MSARIASKNAVESCFGIGRISWKPRGFGRHPSAAIGADLMAEIDDFVGAEMTVYGFTPEGAMSTDHGALTIDLKLDAARTRIGINFGARDKSYKLIRQGFDATAWRKAPMDWESAGIWLTNAEEALAFLCGLGRMLKVRSATFVYGSHLHLHLDGGEEAQAAGGARPRFHLGSGVGNPKGFSASFVGLACAEVLSQLKSFSGAEMSVRFFTPPEATWIDHVAMVIEVRRGQQHAFVGAHFGASFDNGKVFRKMLDTTNWSAASADWRSSGLYLCTWAEAWAFMCGIGQRLNVGNARMCYGEGEAMHLVRMRDGLDAM